MRDGKYQINLPSCPSVCSNKTYDVTSNLSQEKLKVYFHSVCPARHWKNLFKAVIGVDNNHCARPHLDISTSLFGRLGFSYENQDRLKVGIAVSGAATGKAIDITEQKDPTGNHPACKDAESADPRHPGWGWENGRSCKITAPSAYPNCSQGSSADPRHPGWGWENGRSCKISESTEYPFCSRAIGADARYPGWGWENGKSCRLTEMDGYPFCSRASSADPNHPGWGWENGHSCRVR